MKYLIILVLLSLFQNNDCSERIYSFFKGDIKYYHAPSTIPKFILKVLELSNTKIGTKNDSLRLGHGVSLDIPAVRLLFLAQKRKTKEYVIYYETGAIGHNM